MCKEDVRPLTFETMLSDPMIRLVMEADRVTIDEFVATLAIARAAVAARERLALSQAVRSGAVQYAMNAPA